MITPYRTNVSVENRSRGRIHLPVGLVCVCVCVCVCVRAWSRVWGCWRKYPKKRYAEQDSEVKITVTLQIFLCQNISSLLGEPSSLPWSKELVFPQYAKPNKSSSEFHRLFRNYFNIFWPSRPRYFWVFYPSGFRSKTVFVFRIIPSVLRLTCHIVFKGAQRRRCFLNF